jgi:hypothetical protein
MFNLYYLQKIINNMKFILFYEKILQLDSAINRIIQNVNTLRGNFSVTG